MNLIFQRVVLEGVLVNYQSSSVIKCLFRCVLNRRSDGSSLMLTGISFQALMPASNEILFWLIQGLAWEYGDLYNSSYYNLI